MTPLIEKLFFALFGYCLCLMVIGTAEFISDYISKWKKKREDSKK